MKKVIIRFLMVAGGLLACLVSGCERRGGEVEYLYSEKELDEGTKGLLGAITSNRKYFYVTKEAIKASWDEYEGMEYEEYSGSLPEYEFKSDTSWVRSAKGYGTLVMGKEGKINIMYVHGGAWTYRILDQHLSFVEELASRADAKAWLPQYPMLPRWNCEETFPMLEEVYDAMLREGKPIVLSGDSAGGNLILGFTAFLQSKGKKLPDFLLPISPAVDLTSSNPDMEKMASRDPMLSPDILTLLGPSWAGERPLDDPTISPINADLKAFPPVLMYVGTEEIINPDVVLFAEKLSSCGVRTTVFVGTGLWHVAVISNIPAREQFISIALDFIKNE